jgi:hypothetical protein
VSALFTRREAKAGFPHQIGFDALMVSDSLALLETTTR